MTTLYTVGHSRHSAERFAELLLAQQIALLVDVRSHPVSRWAPQFSKDALSSMLATRSLDYVFLGRELGGRPAGAELYGPDGRLDYARRAGEPDFQAGIDRLAALARAHRTAILCAEEDPARCHRRLLVTPAVQRLGLDVVHVRGDGRLEPDAPTPGAPPQLALFE